MLGLGLVLLARYAEGALAFGAAVAGGLAVGHALKNQVTGILPDRSEG